MQMFSSPDLTALILTLKLASLTTLILLLIALDSQGFLGQFLISIGLQPLAFTFTGLMVGRFFIRCCL